MDSVENVTLRLRPRVTFQPRVRHISMPPLITVRHLLTVDRGHVVAITFMQKIT